jgi:hypothetical protein
MEVRLVSELFTIVARVYGFEGFLGLAKPSPTVDERIAKLAAIQEDLHAAIEAVKQLQDSAVNSKAEAEALQQAISQLQQDKKAAEELIKVPEESFARLLQRSSAKARGRGLLEGLAIGLTTGFLSSLLVWYLTK